MIKSIMDGQVGDRVVFPLNWYTGTIIKIHNEINFYSTPCLVFTILWDHSFTGYPFKQKISLANDGFEKIICFNDEKELLQIKLKHYD